jgi:pimeloyl-ACP methyl ester carboxylesterase
MSVEASDHLQDLRTAAAVAGVEVPEFVVPEDHDIILRRMRFHYLDWGTRGRPAILFLHGGGLTAHTWDLVCLPLRREYHCLALDQRGHGDTEWSPVMDYSLEAHLGDIEAFVDLLGLEGFVLVGMSMGGINSIAYAGRHSHRLLGLVLVDVGPEARVTGARRIWEFTATPAELNSVDEFVERAVSFTPLRDPRLLRRSLLHNLRQLPNGKWTWKYDQRHRGRLDMQELIDRHRKLWEEIPQITCPTLVARGALSDVFLDEDAEKLAKALPKGRWVRVDGAGHTVQGDNPGGLLEVLGSFLREIGR